MVASLHDGAVDCGEANIRFRSRRAARQRRPRAGGPRSDPRRRRPGLRRQGLSQLDDRRRRPRERPVGRGDLHVLHGQGRAHPPDLRPDLGARASRSSPSGWPRRRPRPSGWRSPSASTSRPSTNTTARRARPRWSRRGPRPTANPASARCSPRRRERLVGAGQLLLRQGVVARRAAGLARRRRRHPRRSSALLDGLILQRIEAGDALSPGRPRAPRDRAIARRSCWRAAAMPAGAARSRGRPRRRSIAGHGARPDRPRPDRARRRSG